MSERSEKTVSLATYPSDERLLHEDNTDSGSIRTNPHYQSDDSKLATSSQPHEYRRVTREYERVTNEDRYVTSEDSYLPPATEEDVPPAIPPPAAEETTENPTNVPNPTTAAPPPPPRSQRKHKDNAGAVQLLSVRGVSDLPESGSTYFPAGASADMASIHYAAAMGNREALEAFLSLLPVVQDPVEMVLGSNRLCRLEGVDVGDSEGRTPLMHAAHGNHLQCVQLLVGVGANVNTTAKGMGYQTPAFPMSPPSITIISLPP